MRQRKLDRYKRKAGGALDQKDMQSFGHRTDKLQQEHDKLDLAYDIQTQTFLRHRNEFRFRADVVKDIVNQQFDKQITKSEGYVEKTRRGVRRKSQAEYSDNYSSAQTQRTRTRTRTGRPQTRRISRDDETLNQTAKRKVHERTNTDSLDRQGRNIVRGGGSLVLKAVNAGLAIGSIWKMAKGAWGLVFGEKGTAKEHAKEFAIGAALGGAYLGMNHVKRGKVWKSRTDDDIESIDDIPDAETKEAAQHQIQYPVAVNTALSGVPFAILKDYIVPNTNGTIKTIKLQKLYDDAQISTINVKFNNTDMKKLIKLEKEKGIIAEVFANAGITKNTILTYENHYTKNSTFYWINRYGQNLEERENEEAFTDDFGYLPKLATSNLDKQTKEELISEVSKIRDKTRTPINLTVQAGGIMMEQAGHTTLLDLDQHAKTYTTIINGKRYPMHKELTDTKDLVRLAQHEMRVLEHFKTKKTYTQTPFNISGDSIVFDQAPFQRTSTGSYFNRDSLTAYGDGVLGFGAAHETIDALDNDNYLRYYRDRLNDFDWQTNVETDPNQIDIHNIEFVTKLVTSIQGLKDTIDGITTVPLPDGTVVSVFTINGVAQTVEKTWELIKAGSPGDRTGKRSAKAFRFVENTTINVVSGAAIALGNNLTSMYEAVSEELSDSQILNFARDLATKVGKTATDIKEATIEGGEMIITTVSGTTHTAIDYFRDGKIGHAIGYGVIESLQFVGNGLVIVVTEGGGFVVRSTKQFFEGISEAWSN